MSQPISVTQLNRYVAALLDHDPNLASVQVRGELSGFKVYASGHLYFTLKDESAAVSCVMFKNQAAKLLFRPADGMRVILTAKASLYDRDGRFQLYVQSMQSDGIGDLYLAYEQLKARLAAEGLFDAQHKKALPVLPRTIGVVTSPSGAVIRDIIHVLQRRFPGFRLQLIPVAVQGEGAAAQIAAAIRLFNQLGQAEVIIVGRGGGSIEDLWAFNEEIVARAVYASIIPVISAVGHETDYTICDFVADMRAPTPSAAAELAMPVRTELETAILHMQNRLQRALMRQLDLQQLRLRRLLDRPVLVNPLESVNRRRQNLDWVTDRLTQVSRNYYDRADRRLAMLAGKLDALSPLKVLARGYAVVQNQAGLTIQSVSMVQPTDEVDIWLQDGKLACTVNQIMDRRSPHDSF